MSNCSVAPSILSGDFAKMGETVANVEKWGADLVHCDVMDGVFVPNITFGPKFIKDIRPCTKLFFDAHLMVNEPIRYIEEFAKAGCDCITVHTEACSDIGATLNLIRSFGIKCGLTVKPDTPVTDMEKYLDDLDLVLIMSVNPGFGGQGLIPKTLEKVRWLRDVRGAQRYLISIDGGVNLRTIGNVAESGVDVAVAGSAFFNASDKALFVRKMSKGLGENA